MADTITETTPPVEEKPASRKRVEWNGVEITERQKQIMELSETEENAKAVADRLGITPNAVYVTRQRVREILKGGGRVARNGSAFGKKPMRTIRLEDYEAELKGVEVGEEVKEVAQIAESKLTALTELESFHEGELGKIREAKADLTRVIDNLMVKV